MLLMKKKTVRLQICCIDEQVEEESSVKEILDFFVNNQGHGIGMLDHRLGKQQ